MRSNTVLLLYAYLAALSHALFWLLAPTHLGSVGWDYDFNDTAEGESPCGSSFDISNRNIVTSYPVAGYPIHIQPDATTHTKTVFEYRAALLNNTGSWVNLIPPFIEDGVGDLCLPAVPGPAAWVGEDAVLQVVQFGPNYTVFQCAAVKFVSGAAAPAPSSCINTTGLVANFTSITATLPTSTGSATSASAAATSSGAARGLNVRDNVGLWVVPVALIGAWALSLCR